MQLWTSLLARIGASQLAVMSHVAFCEVCVYCVYLFPDLMENEGMGY